MDVGGVPFSTSQTRRRFGDTGARRREAFYGYGGRNDLQQNYGYTMPARTDYGYSGLGPKKNSMMPIALAGVGGLAAGTALGVGGYYVYSQMHNGNWGNGVTYNDRSWCTVPSGQYQGRLIRCVDCMQAFGSLNCRSNNDCFGQGGCPLQLPQDVRRDDIMKDGGFVPQAFTPPLVLTITKISGQDYNPQLICPATQPSDGSFGDDFVMKSSLDMSMFVTLTEMTDFTEANPPPGNADRAWPLSAHPWPALLAIVAMLFVSS